MGSNPGYLLKSFFILKKNEISCLKMEILSILWANSALTLASRFLFICMMLSHIQTNWFLSSWFLKHWVFWLFSKLSDSDMHLRFVSTSQRFLFHNNSSFVPVLCVKWNSINISPCVSIWVCQIQNQMFALGYHLSAKSLLWFIQMMQETQFSPQLSIMIE